jgi:tripartite-type tricarboxylate transporter receptor subunit TctC
MLSGTKRSERVPDIPTARELGVKGFDENAGYMIMVPSATPPDVVARLNKELVRSLQTPELKTRFAAEGAEIIGSTHDQAVTRQNREIEEWAELIRKTGIKLN